MRSDWSSAAELVAHSDNERAAGLVIQLAEWSVAMWDKIEADRLGVRWAH